MKLLIRFILLTIFLLLCCHGNSLAQGYAFKFAIGGGFVDAPQGVVYDKNGNLYVAMYGTNRVQKFDPSGNLLFSLGAGYNGVAGFPTQAGSQNGQMANPTALAIDKTGNLFVSDYGNNRIQKFDPAGNFLLKFGGSYGSANGQLYSPGGIAVDSGGNIYVTDYGNNRVQKFDPAGNFLMAIGAGYNGVAGAVGTSGLAAGQFNRPEGMALDGAGSIYVGDSGNHRVQKFDTTGQFLMGFGAGYNGIPGAIGSIGYDPGDLFIALGIQVDGSGNVYVFGSENGTVQVYDAGGHPIRTIGRLGYSISGTVDIALDGQGHLAVPTGSEGHIYFFDTGGSQTGLISFYSGKGNGQFLGPQAITTDSSGNIYVIDNRGLRFQKFDSNGSFLQTLPPLNYAFPYTYSGAGLTTDTSGHLFVADYGNNRILKYDTAGNYLSIIGLTGTSNGQFSGLSGIATDNAGDVYASDSKNNRVQKFDSNGSFTGAIGAGYNGVAGSVRQAGGLPGQFSNPSVLAMDDYGFLYVVDSGNYRVQKFDSRGKYVSTPLNLLNANLGYTTITALSVDNTGALYFLLRSSSTLYKYDNNGKLILTFGSAGIGTGQFDSPVGLARDAAGNLYITETGTNRVQVIAPSDNLAGSITLDGLDNLTGVRIPLEPVTVQFRNPGSKVPLFSLLALLTPDAADSSKGRFTLRGLPPKTYDLAFKNLHSLQVTLQTTAISGSTNLAAIVLPEGDANNDNTVDIGDFGLLVNAYNSDKNNANSGYDARVDFNYDGLVDIADFGVLVNNYNRMGDL